MTKAELIRKLAKRNGIPDSETKIFFELFLQKASVSLKRGEAVKLNGIGYLQLRQGIIKETFAGPDENIIYADLMVFFPMRNEEVNSDESLIFNVPVSKEDEFNEVDSYFSLSIGKPVIPLEGVNDTEYFSPPSGHELKKLIETKVDKIFRSAEIINKYIKGNEVLIIEPERFNNEQYEFEWVDKKEDFVPSNVDQNLPPDYENKTEFEHLAWDFGEDLSKEIEEEAIIDSATESETITDDLESEKDLEWNFGIPDTDEDYTVPGNTEEEIPEDRSSGLSAEASVPEEINEIENIASDKFERVKSIVSETEENGDNLTATPGNELLEKSGSEISPGINGGDIEKRDSSIPTARTVEKEKKELTGRESDLEKNKEKISEAAGKGKEIVPEIVRADNRNKARDTEINKKYEKTRKKRNSPFVFITALSAIVVIGIVLYLFLGKNVSTAPGTAGSEEPTGVLKASTPVVIERDYRIPVTYPYPAGGNKTGIKNPNDKNNAVASGAKNGAGNKETGKTGGKTTLSSPPQNSIETPKVMDYISRSGRGYLVQVSSWQSEFVAKKEARKFKDKGYQSFIDKVDLKSRGTWYRVKIGYFKTIIAAQQFFNKNH